MSLDFTPDGEPLPDRLGCGAQMENLGKDDSAPEGPRVAVLNAGFVGEARRP